MLMKKIFILFLLAILSSKIVAKEMLSVGFQYGSLWEKSSKQGKTAASWLGSPGIVLNAYSFKWNPNIGIFIQDSLLFPTRSRLTVNNETVIDGVKEADYAFLFEFAIGPVYKFNLSKKTGLCIAAGPNISLLNAETGKYVYNPFLYMTERLYIKNFAFAAGIALNANIKHDITDFLCIDIGSKFVFDFANYIKNTSNISTIPNVSKWNSGYFGFHLAPYIAIGFNI